MPLRAKLKALAQRWNNWVGDRDIERAIQAELRRQGYPSSASQIRDFRLAAIERPGWVCVYQFYVATHDSEGQPLTLYGVVRDDSRVGEKVYLTESQPERNAQRDKWSESLILSPSLRRRG
ncbi:MAG: hypothetical protein AAGA92_15245 [Planctomycetota bacterium]